MVSLWELSACHGQGTGRVPKEILFAFKCSNAYWNKKVISKHCSPFFMVNYKHILNWEFENKCGNTNKIVNKISASCGPNSKVDNYFWLELFISSFCSSVFRWFPLYLFKRCNHKSLGNIKMLMLLYWLTYHNNLRLPWIIERNFYDVTKLYLTSEI